MMFRGSLWPVELPTGILDNNSSYCGSLDGAYISFAPSHVVVLHAFFLKRLLLLYEHLVTPEL